MAEQKWTAEQTAAIENRGTHLLVSAAAGAGKTAVLVERIICSITDPVKPMDIDQLLVVTFTNAAAAEMRERIGLALIKELEKAPYSQYLQRQLTRLGSASIMTLHAFCLDVLRQYYYCIDLDPVFKMSNEAETALLQAQALENVFEGLYAENDQGFIMLVDMYGGSHDDRKLGEIVLKLYEYSRSNPFPQVWLDAAAEQFTSDALNNFVTSHWAQEICGFLRAQLKGCREKLRQAAQLVQQSPGLDGYTKALDDDIVIIEDMLHILGKGWLALEGSFDDKLSGTLPRIKGCCDDQLKEQVQQMRGEVKKQLRKMRSDFFGRPAGEWQEDLQKLGPVSAALVRLVNAFDREYAALKAAKGLLDFSDLEHKCLEILRGDEVDSLAARDLHRRYAEIMVDEYQDINEVQENILHLVSQRTSGFVPMFMVGDVKQSIYRFRLADPSLFLRKYNTYDQNAQHGRRIDLVHNFRSSATVIDAVNYLFRQLMTPYVGEMTYDRKAELVCGLQAAGDFPAKVEVHLIEKQSAPEQGEFAEENELSEDEENLAGLSAEANIIAQRIAGFIKNKETYQIYDKKIGAHRPLQYRDIVILLRATKGKAEIMLDILRKYEIPVYAEVSGGYFAATEVKIMLSLLQIVDNPRQDIPLAAVLRSPVVGLAAEDLAAIRSCSPQGDYWDAVCTCAGGETILAAKLQAFICLLDSWRTIARRQTLSSLIWQLMQDTGLYEYVGSMPGGLQRQANLRALFDRACQYEKTNFRGLFRFLRFIEMLQRSGTDLGTARALGENENVVRIMSVHKSKGLEFPVVFLADIGKRFNRADLNGPVLCHKDLGLGPDIIDLDHSIRHASIAKKAIQLRLKREALSEELRILYVALTRARETLILVGSLKNLAKFRDQWAGFLPAGHGPLPDWLLEGANSWLDWIAPALARHRDGGALRRNNDNTCAVPLLSEERSQWAIRIWDDQAAGRLPDAVENVDEELSLQVPVDNSNEIDGCDAVNARLNWLYPYKAAQGYPAKLSVSELKRRDSVEDEELCPSPVVFHRPRFLQASTLLTPAERGSAVHLVMQHVNLQGPVDATAINAQINTLVQRQILAEAQAQSVDAAQIAGFFTSPLGRRMCEAKKIWRELHFSRMLEGRSLYPELDDEGVFVQGVIDCMFYDDDGMVLVDYKTDAAGTAVAAETFVAYQRQLAIYAAAVVQITRYPVKEAYLYFITTGETVKIPLLLLPNGSIESYKYT